ncbi:bifunctional riboflavin kinase/FAD synthetase [Corynebacterium gerontici]|uniref:Riboflavin biosynthesis protein n=1 Tax=Corynebacterium gerontici TaxID=2079234 RepID=A0A3G6J0Z1_9CORY|nr:bifunctional riboflavin kinase/FAD synthetase [Corynebacterium gerontici]AZA11629.1 Riboflavin biosynthesis protein RibF [Corynebacterium gerontici]
MDIWQRFDEIPDHTEASVVTIGVFDGVHRGHQTLISEATQRARDLGLPSILLTFNPHPLAVLRPDRIPPMLGSVGDRAELARASGIDHMLAMSFSADLARLEPEAFFRDVLMEKLRAKVIVVGENFTFGFKAAGDTDTLKALGKQYGVEVIVRELLAEDGTVLSSTVIREALQRGDVQRANWCLGRVFTVNGQVVRGAGRGGKELGYPTANLYFPDQVALPADGVYAGLLTITSSAPIEGDMERGVAYPAAISVGHNPTFGDERRSVESYVIDREADLYGHSVEVAFIGHIRGMEKFDGVEQLLEAMGRDVAKAKDIIAEATEITKQYCYTVLHENDTNTNSDNQSHKG